ncbi:MAG TPA: winged helix-turn-helix domain-containing protein [Candidatus Saccharimonadia bacterium]|nr:winged helix-turn-helix domain-containing protein [Candidatus Saccharimonadia bacterium]
MKESFESTIRRLRDKIDEQAEEIHQLKQMLIAPVRFPRAWRLTPQEHQLVQVLLANTPRTVPYDRLWDLLTHAQDRSDQPQLLVKTLASRARSKLRPLGVAIRCHWSVGYYLPKEAAVRLWEYTKAEGQGLQ